MITITSATAKRDLLEKLASQANNHSKLVVDVRSLPTFLTTPIAFTIFTYQISNYPRQISWTSENPNILEFLRTCQVETLTPSQAQESEIPSTSYTQVIPSNQIIEIELPEQEISVAEGIEQTQNQPKLQALDLLKKDFNYQPSSLLGEPLYDSSHDHQVFENNQNRELKKEPDLEKNSKNDQRIYETPKKEIFENTKKINILQDNLEQNLDNWLERIESTRQALNSLKDVDQKKFRKPNLFFRTFQFGVVSIILSALVLGMWVFFPTNVYSLDVVSDKKDVSSQLTLSPNRFLKQDRNINETDQIQATGKETISLNQARGKVTIVNRSGGAVSFNRAGIILVSSSGLEYKHIPVNGEPGTFTVPARSDLNGQNLTLTIEASGSGSNYNLPKDSTLRILNLKRDLIGSLLQAVVSEDINVLKETGSNIVQNEDLKSLENQVNKKVEESIKPLINSIKNEDIYTDPSWYNLEDLKYVYTQNVGDVAETVGITATAKVKIFYLNKSLLEEELRLTVPDLKQLISVKSITYTRDGFGGISNPINLNLDYIYSEKIDLDQTELANKLANSDFSTAKSNLQEDYPQIKNIQKQEQGVRLPGVPARVNVTINQKD
jgi:hypothetical protein